MTQRELVKSLLSDIYPSKDQAVELVRDEIERVASAPGRTVVLLQGPPGSGKTTMARAIAVCRRVFVASQSATNLHQDSLRNEILSQKPLTWYRDISLAGLVESLADAQLFGIGEKVASGVTARVGIFEQAMTGHIPSEPAETHERLLASAKQKRRWAPLVTGGVVLLDEIGDLAPSLQAKLLRVLNGERQYRIGKEGNDSYSFQYEGVTILATWRDLAGLENFRPDLWQRIRYNPIRVPSLDTYEIHSRTNLIRSIHRQFKEEAGNENARLLEMTRDSKEEICSADWLNRLARIAKHELTPEMETRLSSLDMRQIGEFRGLRNVISRLMLGSSLDEAVKSAETACSDVQQPPSSIEDQDAATLATALSSETLSLAWREMRSSWAKRVNALLRRRNERIERIVRESGQDRAAVKKQLENLLRSEQSD